MPLPSYLDEKRYAYHVLRSVTPLGVNYQQADATTQFEQHVQQLYASAYNSFATQEFAAALDGFQQLQNLILTTVDPTLPPTSFLFADFVAPNDAGLFDVLAAKSGAVLQSQAVTSYAFPTGIVGAAATLPTTVMTKLAPFKARGLAMSAAQGALISSIDQAATAAAAGDWAGATKAYTSALAGVPDTAPALKAAVMHDLAIATEKSGGDIPSTITMAQNSAALFGTAKVYDAQFEALGTVAGMQQRAGDAAGSQKTLADATTLQTTARLYTVQTPAARLAPAMSAARPLENGAAVTPAATAVLSAPSRSVAPLPTQTVPPPATIAPPAPTGAPVTVERFMAPEFVATLPPQRTFSAHGTTAALSLDLTGNVVQNVHSFLGSIATTTDVSLLHNIASFADPTQIVAYLPAMYYFYIPMAIGDCQLGLGNLEDAASTYAGVLVYPYINATYEIPKLWGKLADVQLAMGDRDYRNAGADATQYASPKADYERIVKTDGTIDPTSVLYADARFGSMKTRVLAFVQSGYSGSFADNPALLSKVSAAHVKLSQIAGGLDFFGNAPDDLPPFSWDYLLNSAKYFAQQASQMEQRFIAYQSTAENETLQREQLDEQAQVAAQGVTVEQRGLDEANLQVGVSNATLNSANVQLANAQSAQAEFASDRSALAEYDELEAWANAASVDQGSEVSLSISGYTYYNVSNQRRSIVIQQLETDRTKITQDEEAAQLQRSTAAAQAYVQQAQAQVAAAQGQVAIANARIALAQMQATDAVQNRDYLDMKEFNARLWFDLARDAKEIAQRYTDMATAVGLLAQSAYNAETGRNVQIVKYDYTHSSDGTIMGADFLGLDLDLLNYDYITTTKTKKAPVKRIISLADSYPSAFRTLQTTGSCMFQTELAMFDRQTPGMYLCKLRNVEVVFVGITSASIAGTLRNVGASKFRRNDGSVVTRLYPADVMPLSAYEFRQDALAFRVDPNDLQLFENHGIDTFWKLDLPLDANDVDLSAIIDVQLVLYYDGFFDPALETTIKNGLAKSGGATRSTSMRLTFPDELFYLRGQGQAQLVFDATLFPLTQINLKRTKSSLRVLGDANTTNGLTLNLTSSALGKTFTVKTDENGQVAGTAATDPLFALNGQSVFDTLTIAIVAADNPQLVTGGNLVLTGMRDVMTSFEYTFDYR